MLLAVPMLAQTPATHQSMPMKPASPAAAATPGTPAPPAHPLTAEQAHQIMKLTGTDQLKDRLIDNMMAFFAQRFPPFIPADVKTDLHDSLEKMNLDTPTVATYQKYISTEDATKIIEFYETPAGKRMLAATPPLMQELQHNAMQTGQDTARGVLEKHKAEIEAAQKQYESQHSSQSPMLMPNPNGAKPANPPATPPKQ